MAHLIQPGELILLFHDEKSTYLTHYNPKGRFESHLGIIHFPEQCQWGEVLYTQKQAAMAIVRPNFGEVLTLLKRRTTVVYPKEAGKIITELAVRAGGYYAEVGSGSGALTSILAMLVGDEGKIYSFERHPEHQAQAKHNIARLAMQKRVEWFLQDPGRGGFTIPPVDGLFIDVPEPWSLIAPAAQVIKPGSPVVVLCPTIDQISRTERAMFDHGFVLRQMTEMLERQWKLFPGRIRPQDRMVGHTAFLLTGRKVLDAAPIQRLENQKV